MDRQRQLEGVVLLRRDVLSCLGVPGDGTSPGDVPSSREGPQVPACGMGTVMKIAPCETCFFFFFFLTFITVSQ